jgi:Lon protease-like protein
MPAPRELPLFPLGTVLFPGAVLALKVFEARYVDLVTGCLRSGAPFGVVLLLEGSDVHRPGAEPVRFEPLGVLAEVREIDADSPGILAVRCQGGARFTITAPRQRGDGLWLADARIVADDDPTPVPSEHRRCAQALHNAVVSLAERGRAPFAMPHRFDDAGWVANRWCELLPIPIAAKQRLMALDDPALRLRLVDEFLHSRGVV